MKRKALYEILLEDSDSAFCSKGQKDHLYNRVIALCEAEDTENFIIKQNLSRFTSQLEKKWRQLGRNHSKLCFRNKTWLDGDLTIFKNNVTKPSCSSTKREKRKRGRPSKAFNESSDRSKRRKTEELRKSADLQKIQFATQMKLRAAGETDAAVVAKGLSLSPSRATKYRKGLKTWDHTLPQVPVNKALAMIVDAGLSKNQYELIKSITKDCGCDVFPSYNKVKEAKEYCYPPMTVSETIGQINLQDQLNHTTQRIMLSQQEVFESRCFSKNLMLISKWGCDGTNATKYKQKFQNDSDTDEYIFITSLVPLELRTEDQTVIWRNPRPSSSRFCRPLRLEFVHETVQVTVTEYKRLENEIKNLLPTECNGYQITHTLIFSMIDGKVCNSVTSTKSAQRCYLCSLTSKTFNDIDKVKQTNINEEFTKFGLSTLHGWIRIFENLLHASYKINIKKWQARRIEEKKDVEEQKRRIQKEFKIKLGLIVDEPKQSHGTSNDGNTARRFFENSEISAEITKIDKNLINRFHIILQAISCGYPLNIEKFQAYTEKTAKMYVNQFEWYPMSTTMHKILMHSATVVKSSILPIGMLSEEAQEARNKDIRKYRENFARKCSRTRNMEDVVKRLLLSSDPCISQLFNYKNSNRKNFSKELIDLLSEPK